MRWQEARPLGNLAPPAANEEDYLIAGGPVAGWANTISTESIYYLQKGVFSVNVHIEMLHHQEGICTLLRHHGWRLDRMVGAACYSAHHPTVTDQATARAHLNVAGLLISPNLRIEFGPDAD
jgi:hypothetical protein